MHVILGAVHEKLISSVGNLAGPVVIVGPQLVLLVEASVWAGDGIGLHGVVFVLVLGVAGQWRNNRGNMLAVFLSDRVDDGLRQLFFDLLLVVALFVEYLVELIPQVLQEPRRVR